MSRLLQLFRVNRLPASGPTGPRLHGQPARADRFGGRHRIYGTVTVEDVPSPRRVVLIDRRTLNLIRSTWATAGGSYSFEWIRAEPVLVIGLDYTRIHSDEIYPADPEPMP